MNHALSQSRLRQALLVRSIAPILGVLMLLAGPTLLAATTFQSLSQRLPASTDAIVAVNVDGVLDSPYGKEQQWRQSMAENWAKRPQIVLPGVRRLLMGAEFVPSQAESRWEVALMEMETMPSVKDLAEAEGGHIDRVWDKDAVVSPINAYFVPIDKDVLAVCTPGERAIIARWVRQPVKPEGAVTSEYIRNVLSGLEDQPPVVMAMDLEGAFGLPNIRRFLDNLELEELKDENLDGIAVILSSLKGLTLQIAVDQKINATLLINFDKDAGRLGPLAKPLLVSVLNVAGMHLDEIDDWKFVTAGKEVRGMGELSEVGFRRLLGIVQSPVPAAVAAAAAPQKDALADPVSASQRYFRSVSLTLDGLKAGPSTQQTATWWLQAAKRIDKLPILNVDPELVEWGTFVSMKLKELAGTGAAGQTAINARVAGVQNPDYGNAYYDGDGFYHWENRDSRDRAQAEEARRQRRQAALEQKSQVQQQAQQILNEANGARQKVRAAMTSKYNVEF